MQIKTFSITVASLEAEEAEMSRFRYGVLCGMLVEIAIALPLRVRIRQSS